MRPTRLLPLLILALLAAGGVRAEYVRDEIRINLRTGPGKEFRILRTLHSGDPVRRIDSRSGWDEVETPDGESGWLPAGYLVDQAPASTALPQTQAALADTSQRLRELEAQLAAQATALRELDELRAQTDGLTKENADLKGASRWKHMTTGAAIAFAGVLVGRLWPRGSGRARRIKLE